MKIEFSIEFFEKYTNITYHDNWPAGAVLFHKDGLADN